MTNISYIKGFEIKPSKINANGIVTFTDGVNEITPNQIQCERYGYTYDNVSRVCKAFTYTRDINIKNKSAKNNVQGDGNTLVQGANNTYVMGEKNTLNSGTRNNIVVGFNHKVDSKVQNTASFGIGAVAKHTGAMFMGGNNLDDRHGTRQVFNVIYGCQTTDNSTTDSLPNNGLYENVILQVNRAYYFQSETMAVRVGGSSGTGAVGDFKAWVERGVVLVNTFGVGSISRSRTSPASNGLGLSGWSPINAVDGVNFRQTVKGATDMTIEWVSHIRFVQLFTGVSIL